MLQVTWGSTVDTDMETDSSMRHDTDGTLPTWTLEMNRDTDGDTLAMVILLAEGMVTRLLPTMFAEKILLKCLTVANIDTDNLTMLTDMDGDTTADMNGQHG